VAADEDERILDGLGSCEIEIGDGFECGELEAVRCTPALVHPDVKDRRAAAPIGASDERHSPLRLGEAL
jgi:hypothetical protein